MRSVLDLLAGPSLVSMSQHLSFTSDIYKNKYDPSRIGLILKAHPSCFYPYEQSFRVSPAPQYPSILTISLEGQNVTRRNSAAASAD